MPLPSWALGWQVLALPHLLCHQLVLCNDSSSQIKLLAWWTRALSWVEAKWCPWSSESCWVLYLALLEIPNQPEHHLSLGCFCGHQTPVQSPCCGCIIFPNIFILWLTQEHIPAALRRAQSSNEQGLSGLLSRTKHGKFQQAILCPIQLLGTF